MLDKSKLEQIEGVRVIDQAPLDRYSTFRLGGTCSCLIECVEEGPLIEVVRALTGTPFILIGGGSNILFSDAGFEGVLVRYCSNEPRISRAGLQVTVSGATILDDLAAFSVEAGLDGLVNTSGIPGTVGGAVVGNAGAWGWQIGDAVCAVRVIDRAGQIREVPTEELDFTYRHSRLKTGTEIVLSVSLDLRAADPMLLATRREEILALRAEKHPNLAEQPCIGSIFKNIEPTSSAHRRQAAGYFLEQAGARDMRVGGAEVYEKHANIIVKGIGCSAQDVHDLSVKMAEATKRQLGIELVREVRFLGCFAGAETSGVTFF